MSSAPLSNISSGLQSEDFNTSSNLDDNNSVVSLQSHSSSLETPRPTNSFTNKRKYSTSHIQLKNTPNTFESLSPHFETTVSDTHTSTVPPMKSVFGSFTILGKSHFGDVFASVASTNSPSENTNDENRLSSSSVSARKKKYPAFNKHAGLIETSINDEPFSHDVDSEGRHHSSTFSHNDLSEFDKPILEKYKEIISDEKLIRPLKANIAKEEISGIGEAHVVVLPATSYNHDLLLSQHGIMHAKPTTYRPHTTRGRHTTHQSVPPDIVVSTEARKSTSISSLPKRKINKNEIPKEVRVLKQTPIITNQNLDINHRKDTETIQNFNSHLTHDSNLKSQKNKDDYDPELESISSFLKSEFPVLQKIGNLDEVLKAYQANRTPNNVRRKNAAVSNREPHYDGDLSVMESSHEFHYAPTLHSPGPLHSPVVTLLPVRSNVGPGKPLRPRPYLGTRNNIGTTNATTSLVPIVGDGLFLYDSDYIDESSHSPKVPFSTLAETQYQKLNSEKDILDSIGSTENGSSAPVDLGVHNMSNIKGHHLDYGSLNTRDFFLPSQSHISDHIINNFSESLVDRMTMGGSLSHDKNNPLMIYDQATTEESRKIILNTEVVTSTSVKVSYGEGTASYAETSSDSSLRRPKRRENFRRPKIVDFWDSNKPIAQIKEDKPDETLELPSIKERKPKMAQDFLLHSNIHKIKFDRNKKDKAANTMTIDRNDFAKAPFVVYAMSVENNDNPFSYDSFHEKEIQIVKSKLAIMENTRENVDQIERVDNLNQSSIISNLNENMTFESNSNNTKVAQNLLNQMIEKYTRDITNESSGSSLKYLIDQISRQHLKQSHHHKSDTNISTKAVPASFNFNQVNGIPILTKVFTKIAKSNSTMNYRNQTEFHLSMNRSGMKYIYVYNLSLGS